MTGQPHQIQLSGQDRNGEPAPAYARKRHAGHLVRVNLPPLMGQRDAALDQAEKTLADCENGEPIDAATAAAAARMYADAEKACTKIIGMFNNPDTISRESRLLNNVRILSELTSALADFYRLRCHMSIAVNGDAAGDEETNRIYVDTLDKRMLHIAAELSAQLGDARNRYRQRIARYRDYAVKNLSPENAGRYRSAYDAAVAGYIGMSANICQQKTSK
ncbi:MAG: hypothetical protein IJW35_01085 [Lentisphaeria bacterium]|nr:hypothetical protein [Lentisphaeria bacterium]